MARGANVKVLLLLLRLGLMLSVMVAPSSCEQGAHEASEWPSENLVGHWHFDNVNANDRTGNWGRTRIFGTTVTGLGLYTKLGAEPGYANAGEYTGPSLGQRTLVANIQLSTLGLFGGGVFIGSSSNATYDGLCFGSIKSKAWGICSEGPNTARSKYSSLDPEWASGVSTELTMTQRTVYSGGTASQTETAIYIDGMLWRKAWTSNSVALHDDNPIMFFGMSPLGGSENSQMYVKWARLYNCVFEEHEIRVPVSSYGVSANSTYAGFQYRSAIQSNANRWARFMDVCARYGMYLGSFSSAAERVEYQQLVKDSPGNYYSGVAFLRKTMATYAVWEYLDGPHQGKTWCLTNRDSLAPNGCKVDKCPWDANEPSSGTATNLYQRTYYRISATEVRIDDVGFDQNYYFVCQKSEVMKEYGRYKSFAGRRGFTYSRGKMLCKAKGGWLATFPTAEHWAEAQHVMDGSTSEYVAAGTDTAEEGVWIWDDGPLKGTVFYRNGECQQGFCFWPSLGPSNSNSRENWLEVNPNTWNDQDTGDKQDSLRKVGVICEFNVSLTATATISPPRTMSNSRSPSVSTTPVPTQSPSASLPPTASDTFSLTRSSSPSVSLPLTPSRTFSVIHSRTTSVSVPLSTTGSITISGAVTTTGTPTSTAVVTSSSSVSLSTTAAATASSSIGMTLSRLPSQSFAPSISRSLSSTDDSLTASSTLGITTSVSGDGTATTTPTVSGGTRSATLDFLDAALVNTTTIFALGFEERVEQRLAFSVDGALFDIAAAFADSRGDVLSALPVVPVHWCAVVTVGDAGSSGCYGCLGDRGGSISSTSTVANSSDAVVQLLLRGNVTLEIVDSTHARLVFAPWGGIAGIVADRELSLHVNPGCFRRRRSFPILNFTLVHTERTESVPEEVVLVSKSGGEVAAVVSGIGNPAIATQMSRSTIVLNLASCQPEEDQPLDRSKTPLRFGLGSTPMAFYVGGATINHGVQWSLTAALAIVGAIYARAYGVSVWEGFEVSRFPSLASFPLMLLLEPTCMCATTVIVQLGGAYKVLGGISLGMCCVLPFALFGYLRHNRHKLRFYDCWDPEEHAQTTNFKKFLFGGAKWIDRDGPRTSGFCQRNRMLFSGYTGDYYWFLCVEMVMSIVCGVLDGVKLGPGACNAVIISLIVGFATFLLVILKTRPYTVPFALTFAVVMTSLQLAAASCVAAKVFFEVKQAQLYAEWIAMGCMWLLIGRTAYDIGPNAFRWYKGLLVWIGARKRSTYRPPDLQPAPDGPGRSSHSGGVNVSGPDAGPNRCVFTEGLHAQLQGLLSEDEKRAADLDGALLSCEVVHHGDGLTDVEMATKDSMGAVGGAGLLGGAFWGSPSEGHIEGGGMMGIVSGKNRTGAVGDDEALSSYSDTSTMPGDLPNRRRWFRGGEQRRQKELDLIMTGVDDDHPLIVAMRKRRAAREARIASSTSTVLSRVVETAKDQGNASTAALTASLARLAALDNVANKRHAESGDRPTLDEAVGARCTFDYGEDGPLIEPIALLNQSEVHSLTNSLRDARAMEAPVLLQRVDQWAHAQTSTATAGGTYDLLRQIGELRDEISLDTAVLDDIDPEDNSAADVDDAIWDRDALGELLDVQLDRADVLQKVGEPVTQDPLQLSTPTEVKKLHRSLVKDGSLAAHVLAAVVKKARLDVLGESTSGGAKRPKVDTARAATSRLVAELDLDLDGIGDTAAEVGTHEEAPDPFSLLGGLGGLLAGTESKASQGAGDEHLAGPVGAKDPCTVAQQATLLDVSRLQGEEYHDNISGENVESFDELVGGPPSGRQDEDSIYSPSDDHFEELCDDDFIGPPGEEDDACREMADNGLFSDNGDSWMIGESAALSGDVRLEQLMAARPPATDTVDVTNTNWILDASAGLRSPGDALLEQLMSTCDGVSTPVDAQLSLDNDEQIYHDSSGGGDHHFSAVFPSQDGDQLLQLLIGGGGGNGSAGEGDEVNYRGNEMENVRSAVRATDQHYDDDEQVPVTEAANGMYAMVIDDDEFMLEL